MNVIEARLTWRAPDRSRPNSIVSAIDVSTLDEASLSGEQPLSERVAACLEEPPIRQMTEEGVVARFTFQDTREPTTPRFYSRFLLLQPQNPAQRVALLEPAADSPEDGSRTIIFPARASAVVLVGLRKSEAGEAHSVEELPDVLSVIVWQNGEFGRMPSLPDYTGCTQTCSHGDELGTDESEFRRLLCYTHASIPAPPAYNSGVLNC